MLKAPSITPTWRAISLAGAGPMASSASPAKGKKPKNNVPSTNTAG